MAIGQHLTAPVSVGEVIAGKYRIERMLGRGGMGVVYSATHLQLGELVAIKMLLPEARGHEEIVKRFLREARAAAKIRGEHVARVYDVGTFESNGSPYLVMEYLEGMDLGAKLRQSGAMPQDEVLEYVLQACEAIAEAHSMGIVHRDLKPGNLFLTSRADGSPVIKVIDFGISKLAKVAQLPDDSDMDMTRTAVMLGSPTYMAPEQLASARDADERSDIWSFGVILHSLLVGKPPFRADTVVKLFEAMLAGAPPLRSFLPNAPEGLEAVILRCLNKEPQQRFASIGDFAVALADFAPIHARVSVNRVLRIPRNSVMISSPLPPAPAALNSLQTANQPATGLIANPNATASPWTNTPSISGRSRRRVTILAAMAAASIVLIIAGFVMLRGNDKPVSANVTAVSVSSPAAPSSPPVIETAPATSIAASHPSASASSLTKIKPGVATNPTTRPTAQVHTPSTAHTAAPPPTSEGDMWSEPR